MKPTIIVLFMVIISGCQPKVEKINYHEDECHHCKMIISDSKFGADPSRQQQLDINIKRASKMMGVEY